MSGLTRVGIPHIAVAILASLVAAGAESQTPQTTVSPEGESQTPQTMVSPEGEAGSTSPTNEGASAEQGIYSKRVGGIVWLEGTFGVSRFNVTKFRSAGLLMGDFAPQLPAVVVRGPELGAALKFRLGSATIGAHFKKANYDPFDLITAGIDFGFMIRAIPYVHPTFRLALNYHTARGMLLPGYEGLVRDMRTHGAGVALGAGIRVPIVKWVSIAAGVDYSVIGLVIRGTSVAGGDSLSAGTVGSAISGTFSLTIHLGHPGS